MGQSTDSMNRTRSRVVHSTDSTDHSGEERDVATMKAEIARTRGEMSATIDAIQYKLEPDRIKRQVKASVRGATIGKAEQMLGSGREAGNGMIDRIRQNPIPAAMVAVGLGWLITRQPEREMSYDYYADTYGSADYDYADTSTGMAGQHAGTMRDTVADRTSEVRDRVANRTSEMRDQVANRTSEMRDQVASRTSEMRGQLDQRTAEMRSRATYRAQRARGSLEQMMVDNPLGMGAIALAVGAAIGLAAPPTDRENELMGEARDNVMDKAQAAAQEKINDVKNVASTVAQNIT